MLCLWPCWASSVAMRLSGGLRLGVLLDGQEACRHGSTELRLERRRQEPDRPGRRGNDRGWSWVVPPEAGSCDGLCQSVRGPGSADDGKRADRLVLSDCDASSIALPGPDGKIPAVAPLAVGPGGGGRHQFDRVPPRVVLEMIGRGGRSLPPAGSLMRTGYSCSCMAQQPQRTRSVASGDLEGMTTIP